MNFRCEDGMESEHKEKRRKLNIGYKKRIGLMAGKLKN